MSATWSDAPMPSASLAGFVAPVPCRSWRRLLARLTSLFVGRVG